MRLNDAEIQEAWEFVTQELGRSAQQDTFKERIQPTYERLIQSAKNGETITYGELADYANTDDRRYMSKLLDGIGYIEDQRGNPPTTVLVVHADDGRPANDFLQLLESLGIQDDYVASTDRELIDEIMDAVLSHYSK